MLPSFYNVIRWTWAVLSVGWLEMEYLYLFLFQKKSVVNKASSQQGHLSYVVRGEKQLKSIQ